MAEPIITTLNSLTLHKGIKDKNAYETLMKQGEIKEGDICFIDDSETSETETVDRITNTEIEEILNNFTE